MKKEDIMNTDVDYIVIRDHEGNIIDYIDYNNVSKNKTVLYELKEKLLRLKEPNNKNSGKNK